MTHATILAAVPAAVAHATLLHWAALLAFCVVLGFQLCLFECCRRALARLCRVLVALREEGRVPEQPFARNGLWSEWLEWVATRFHDGGFQDGHYSREHALGQLDDCLGSVGSYRLLQRTGYVAPMIGLLLTVAGFLSVDLPTTADWDLRQIIQTLSPIILGVGVGALLAIINLLVLLHLLEKKIECRADRGLPMVRRVHLEARASQASPGGQRLCRGPSGDGGNDARLHGPVSGCHRDDRSSCAIPRDAATALVNAGERLSAETTAFSGQMKDWQSTVTGTVGLMGDIVPNIERTTAEFAETAGALKSVVQVPLAQAAARQQESAESFARSVERMGESTEQLNVRLGSFDKMMSDQAAAGEEWSRSLHEDVIPAQRAIRQAGTQLTDATKDLAATQQAFRAAADSMQGSANGLVGFVRDGVEPATQRLAELDQVLAEDAGDDRGRPADDPTAAGIRCPGKEPLTGCRRC